HRALSEHKTLSVSWSHYQSAFLTVYIVSPAFAFFSFQIPFISQCKTTPSVICGGEAMKSMDKISTVSVQQEPY
ncbi:hypothetical protein, partial [Shigella boydii]|uniref:hypothetical protein n=1 Tax=Shigella boydii TaxID=621 RepID=UPI0019D43D4C